MEVDSDDWLRFCLTVDKALTINIHGYVVYSLWLKNKNKIIQFHRWVLNFPSNELTSDIDHINGIKTDNRKENLRLVTRSQNNFNPNNRLSNRNTSGYRGVSWREKENKWEAYITLHSKRHSLGLYTRKEDAIYARKDFEKRYCVSGL